MKRSETSGRSDDNIDVIRKRFKTFQSETMEVINLYSKQEKLVTVNSEGTIESIFHELSKHFEKLE
jgi:adenylate kinase family enzyme